jgi:excinuclease UvrABC nuclease subunit
VSNWNEIVWRRIPSITAAAREAPSSPGVYIFSETKKIASFPFENTWLYIGQSKNLKRRMKEHGPVTEAHLELRDWVVKNLDSIEVWIYTAKTVEIARKLEKHLLQRVDTVFNRQK